MFSVYITSIVPAGLTYIFWLIVANQTSAEIIGIVVSLTAFSMVLSSFAAFEIPIGMKRFLGMAQAEQNDLKFKQIIIVSTIFVTLSSILILIITLNPFFNILNLVGIDSKFTPIIVTIVIGNGLVNIFVNSLISGLKSKSLVIPYIVSSFGRFPILLILFYFIGESEMNVAWAFSSHYIILAIITMSITIFYFRKGVGKNFNNFVENLKIVFHSGLPRYIPQVISSLQTQFSILTIFSIHGPTETGIFYISFAIFSIISMIPSAINGVSHPVLSGMIDSERGKFLLRSLKIGFLSTIPLAVIAAFYSEPILLILGEEFIGSTEIILILLISLPMAIITNGCYFFLYAKGNYKKVLYLGLSVNISRIILYFLLVPEFGGVGAAISYVIGGILQLGLTIVLMRNTKINLEYKKYVIISIIPLGLGFMLNNLQNEIISSILIIILSFMIFSKLKMFDEQDLESCLRIIVSKERIDPTKKKIIGILTKLRLT